MPNGGQSANQYKGMILDLVHCFLCTISARIREKTNGKDLARAAKTLLSLGAPDCPVRQAGVW
jgi:hypothetical protein